MPLTFSEPTRRDTRAYRAFRARILAERPVCELCNHRRSGVVAHIIQPLLGGPLMDGHNVLALCTRCDALETARHPPLRRRPKRRL